MTRERQRYVQNYLCVTQMRPDYESNAAKNPEDLFSDEEVDMKKVTFLA